MSYDFDYYSGRHLTYPERPSKPTLGRNPNSAEARAYADALEEYEREYRSYQENVSFYGHQTKILLQEFKNKLKSDFGLHQQEFNVIWSKAWEDGHSNGLYEVYCRFDSLVDFVAEYNKAMKGI